MRVWCYVLFLIFGYHSLYAQKEMRTRAYTVQYAGSVGFASVGYYRQSPKDKLGIGLIYGNTPKSMGGPLGSLSLKIRYNPFSIRLYKNIHFDPIQAGIFLTQNFGKNLDFRWPQNYPKGYYWWGSSFRQHVFVSTQIAYVLKKGYLSKIALYLEANTNDLYLYSYFPNRDVMSPYDIIFLGAGTKFYLRHKPKYTSSEP